MGTYQNQNVLDIGSGWGGMASYLSKRSNVNVKGVTLSEEQIAYSKQRKIDESLDKLTDLIFGASQCPGYYKNFPKPKGINIFHNEIEN